MHELGSLDFETFSSSGFCWNDETRKWVAPVGARKKGLGVVGTTAYAQHHSTEVLTLSYRHPGETIKHRWRPSARACVVVRKDEPHDVYIGRPSEWGNPFVIGPDGDRPTVIAKYRAWILQQPHLMAKVRGLAGKRLGCFCAPEACHGDVLSELAAWPWSLFDRLAAGAVYKAHNFFFEMSIWEVVCVAKYGWPSIMPWRYQFRCTMATARVNSFPGALGDLSNVLKLPTPKDADGTRLLDKFSVPRNVTKADARWRIRPTDPGEEIDAEKLYGYCDTDLDAEEGAYGRMLPMSPDELQFWWIDQEINWRGMAVDRAGIRDCIAILNAVFDKYVAECKALTGFAPSQGQALLGWIAARGLRLPNMKADTLATALGPTFTYEIARNDDDEGEVFDDNGPPIVTAAEMPADVRRAIELRVLTASASVKKLFAMDLRASHDDRLTNLIIHHGARTGRPTGDSVQPLNLPRAGPDLRWCDQPACHRPFAHTHTSCPWCQAPANPSWKTKWSGRPKGLPESVPSAVDFVLEVMAARNLDALEWFFGDALACIAGCIRGLFVAGPGMELICSDYAAIETVVTAALAGEQWRLDTIRAGVDIYLASASKITGRTLEEYLAYKDANGEHHPDRQRIGKVNELANGFGGWIGASKAFGSTEPDDVIKRQILAWRAASPRIVEMWGGQFRGAPWDPTSRQEYFGFEGMAIQAILYPGVVFSYAGIEFQVRPHPAGWNSLFVRLLPTTDKPGRELTYHMPTLTQSTRPYARQGEYSITYWTWNTNTKYGPRGWIPMSTFGGRLTENIVQATAHDIQRFGIKALRAAGYHMVLHVYDENCAEVPAGTGSIEEFERIMSTMPPRMASWPIKAAGGWRGRRYRKA